MLRSLIAVIIAVSIVFTGIIKPAYAEDNIINYNNYNYNFNDFSVKSDQYFIDYSDKNRKDLSNFIEGIKRGALEAAGITVGGVIVCYSIDGVATAFFPPAATLAAFCPAMGGTLGSGNAATKLFKAFVKAKTHI
jgi:hypothetical protein